MQDKSTILTLSFTSLQPNWPFMDFKTQISSLSYFLILEEKLKKHHGCIQNIRLYLDYQKKSILSYGKYQKIGQKLAINADLKGLSINKEIIVYYEFDNGYEWPLLSF